MSTPAGHLRPAIADSEEAIRAVLAAQREAILGAYRDAMAKQYGYRTAVDLAESLRTRLVRWLH